MNGFINFLVNRHIDTNRNIKPRARGIFDPELSFSNALADEAPPSPDTWADKDPSPTESDQPTPAFQGFLTDKIEEKATPEAAEPKSLFPDHGRREIKSTIGKQKNDESFLPVNKVKISPLSIPLPFHPTLENKDLQGKISEPEGLVITSNHDKAEEKTEKEDKIPPVKKNVVRKLQKKQLDKNYFYGSRIEMEQIRSDYQPGELSSLINKTSEVKTGQSSEVQKNEINPQDTGYLNQMVVPTWKQDIENKSDQPLIDKRSKAVTKQVINVTIGRVEVRASFPPVEIKTATQTENKNTMSLDQFLDEKNQALR